MTSWKAGGEQAGPSSAKTEKSEKEGKIPFRHNSRKNQGFSMILAQFDVESTAPSFYNGNKIHRIKLDHQNAKNLTIQNQNFGFRPIQSIALKGIYANACMQDKAGEAKQISARYDLKSKHALKNMKIRGSWFLRCKMYKANCSTLAQARACGTLEKEKMEFGGWAKKFDLPPKFAQILARKHSRKMDQSNFKYGTHTWPPHYPNPCAEPLKPLPDSTLRIRQIKVRCRLVGRLAVAYFDRAQNFTQNDTIAVKNGEDLGEL